MRSSLFYRFLKRLKYIGIAILVLWASACSTIHKSFPMAESTVPVLATSRPPSDSTNSPTWATHPPTTIPTATSIVVTSLPTASRPVTEALFIILANDQLRFLAAYEGQTHFQVLYEIPSKLGKAQVISYPIPFPAVSSDGRMAVVIENKITGRSDIYFIDGTTGTAQPILTWAGPQFEATISPDGRRVAFLSSDGECPEQEEFAARVWCPYKHLYVMDVGSGNIKRLTTEPANRCSLTWSPTNVQLAYQEGCTPVDPSQIYVITFLDNDHTRTSLITRDGAIPSWSSDGRWLHWGSVGGLQYVGLLSTSGEMVSQFKLGRIWGASDVAWSPDSKQMIQAVHIGGEISTLITRFLHRGQGNQAWA